MFPKKKLKDIKPKSEEKQKFIQRSELIPDESTRLSLINDVVRHLPSIELLTKSKAKEYPPYTMNTKASCKYFGAL